MNIKSDIELFEFNNEDFEMMNKDFCTIENKDVDETNPYVQSK